MRALIAAIIMLVIATATATAQPDEDLSAHVSIRVDAQVLTDYDDSDLFVNGFDAGVTGWWALTGAWVVGVRFGLSHWSYDAESTVADLVPPGSQPTFSQSSGQIDIYSLIPMIRYQREEVFPARLGAFVEAGAGAAHVKTFALSEVRYSGGGSGETAASFEIDESSTEVSMLAMAGITRAVTSSSWFEVLGSYHAILADETADVWGVGIGIRVQI